MNPDIIQLAKEFLVSDQYFTEVDIADRRDMGRTLAEAVLRLSGESISQKDEESICKTFDIDRARHRKAVGE